MENNGEKLTGAAAAAGGADTRGAERDGSDPRLGAHRDCGDTAARTRASAKQQNLFLFKFTENTTCLSSGNKGKRAQQRTGARVRQGGQCRERPPSDASAEPGAEKHQKALLPKERTIAFPRKQ